MDRTGKARFGAARSTWAVRRLRSVRAGLMQLAGRSKNVVGKIDQDGLREGMALRNSCRT
jgi:hypothetical protein